MWANIHKCFLHTQIFFAIIFYFNLIIFFLFIQKYYFRIAPELQSARIIRHLHCTSRNSKPTTFLADLIKGTKYTGALIFLSNNYGI